MICPECGSSKLFKDGLRYTNEGQIQRYLCRVCGYRFSESTIKVDVAGKVIEMLDSAKNHNEVRVSSGNASNEKVNDSLPFSLCKNIGSHNTSIVEKDLNGLPFYDSKHQVCAQKDAKNLNPAIEIKTVAGEEKQTTKGKILQFALYLKLQGNSEHTIKGFSQKLRRLDRNADLDAPDTIKKYLALLEISESSKHAYCVAYIAFLKWQNKTWKPPKYRGIQKIPEFIPTEKEIDALIAGCGRKTATILQTLKETGMRIGECLSLTWGSLNAEARTLTLNTPEKNSLPRIFRISPKLISMLQALPKNHDKIFGNVNPKTPAVCLAQQRKKIAKKLANPRIAKIHFHLIRHWVGTMEYHNNGGKLVEVQKKLGHKNILNTMIYINLEQALFDVSDDFIVKVASSIEQATKLLEVGFEYVTEMDGKKLFRKRK